MGRSTSKCLNLFHFPTHRYGINFYKLVYGERTCTWTFIDIIVAFCNFCSFSCNRDAKWKEPSWGGPPAPLMRGTVSLLRGNPPLEVDGESPSWAGFPYWHDHDCKIVTNWHKPFCHNLNLNWIYKQIKKDNAPAAPVKNSKYVNLLSDLLVLVSYRARFKANVLNSETFGENGHNPRNNM